MAEGGFSVGPLEIHGPAHDVAASWRKWKRSFAYYVTGKGITDAGRKKALLLHYAGVHVQELFDTLTLETGGADDYDNAILTLDKRFAFKPNFRFERYKLRQMSQESGETVDQFVSRLRVQAQHCEFADDTAISDQLCDLTLEKLTDEHLRKLCLQEDALTLKNS